ncbi:histidine decarboxylase maturation protein HdcB [Fructobacillus sp. M1-13]|uniref:DUF5449 family protein n=1 Tax=Fructobacillus papyriferae TaxID=2713171 RepID=A0ABS5QQ17_9LACO|nr:histidine decarboxylase maturation protein HdcB [Fructobacillus papyriferae]MBS9335283.1 DUF5449 family protein [Fructobacillus papyriferae]MCD2159048.1 histidine decarboxylase maturation protein HdcB [Fructobacillus papyriferae]
MMTKKDFQQFVSDWTKQADLRLRGLLIGEDEKGQPLAIGYDGETVYLKSSDDEKRFSRNAPIKTTFVAGVPNGKLTFSVDGQIEPITLQKIQTGRVYDLTQALDPKPIYKASYDGSQALQSSVYFDPEHAELIDELRYEMQTGQISQHDYDSLNPMLPKAGK